ncbi:MAG: hypothetical protein WC701_00870 [Kiritimatiellales bacterium]
MISEESHGFPAQCRGAQEDLFDGFFTVIVPDGLHVGESSSLHNARDDEVPVSFGVDSGRVNIPEEVFRQSICKSVFHRDTITQVHLPGKREDIYAASI